MSEKKSITITLEEKDYVALMKLKERYKLDSTNETVNLLLQGAMYAVTKDKKRLYNYSKSRVDIYSDILEHEKYDANDARETRNLFLKIAQLLEEY